MRTPFPSSLHLQSGLHRPARMPLGGSQRASRLPSPANRVEAITFNLWRHDKLGSALACAVMRHAWSHMYVRFAKVAR